MRFAPDRFLLAGLVLLPSAAMAQRTWTVGGPGANFTDLPPALAAAADGDTIDVRPGTYKGGQTSKALTLLGSGSGPGGSLITGDFFSPLVFSVAGLPAGKTFAMKDFWLQHLVGVDAMHVLGNSGRVHLENVTLTAAATYNGPATRALRIDTCSQVTIAGCLIRGAPGLDCRNSNVAISSTKLVGQDGEYRFFNAASPFPAATLDTSEVSFSWGLTQGGNGAVIVGPAPAMRLGPQNRSLTLAGDSGTLFAAGAGGPGPTPAIVASGSVLVDPNVQIIPYQGASPISGGTVTTQRVPALWAIGTPPGGILTTSLFSPAGETVILLLSRPADAMDVPPFGRLWLDPLRIFYVAVGFQPPGETWTLQIPIAPFATRGLSISVQGLSGPGLDVKLSTPTVVVLD